MPTMSCLPASLMCSQWPLTLMLHLDRFWELEDLTAAASLRSSESHTTRVEPFPFKFWLRLTCLVSLSIYCRTPDHRRPPKLPHPPWTPITAYEHPPLPWRRLSMHRLILFLCSGRCAVPWWCSWSPSRAPRPLVSRWQACHVVWCELVLSQLDLSRPLPGPT
jgi:hypothetical protein